MSDFSPKLERKSYANPTFEWAKALLNLTLHNLKKRKKREDDKPDSVKVANKCD